jgi:CBS domain-containing protein
MTTCRDVMTREPVYCRPDDSVSVAADLMRTHNVGALPVVEAGRLVGIVTDRDLVVKVVAGDLPVEGASVRQAMTDNPATCGEQDDVKQLLTLMASRQVRRVPVLDPGGRLVGIIAQADIATRLQVDQRTGELVEAISEPGSGRA